MPEIRLEALRREHRDSKGGRVTALRNLTLTIGDGELLSVVGPSGSGKTTLLRLVAGLDEPDAGTVWIGGQPVSGRAPRERGVAMVMQDHPLFPHLDVEANLGLAPKLSGLARSEIECQVSKVAKVLGLERLLKRSPHELSGGERQLVGLGGALASGARVLLLDEPLAQLDARTRARLRVEIRRVQREFRATLIHVTHDQAEAMAMADRLAVVRLGELEQVGLPLEVYGRPASRFVAEFLGSPGMNLWQGRLRETPGDRVFEVEGGAEIHLGRDVPRPTADGDSLVLGVRPEDMRLGAGTGWVEGVVEAVERLGHEAHVRLRMGTETLVIRAAPGVEVGVGDARVVGFGGDSVHWFGLQTGRRLAEAPKRPEGLGASTD